MDLTDRVAIVTGASSGIGAATATALAEAGCSVSVAARREDRLREVADEIGDGRAIPVPTDVTEEADAAALVETTKEAFGRVDVVVNNAGVLTVDRFAEADLNDVREQIDVNLLGAMNVTHAALPEVIASGGGDVVTVSSLNARHPAANASAYTASKFGVNGFCRALRKEVAEEGVRVTTVMPGPVASEMNDWEDWDGRALDPEDVAEAIVFAVSQPEHVSIPELSVDATDAEW